MPSSVVIRSPRPNNLRIAVMKQTLSADGDPVGDPEHIALLDDGDEFVTEVGLHSCIILVEHGRDPGKQLPRPGEDSAGAMPAVIGAGEPAHTLAELERLVALAPGLDGSLLTGSNSGPFVSPIRTIKVA